MHHVHGALENAAAAEREQRVADKHNFIVAEIIGDVSKRMAGRFDDARARLADFHAIAFRNRAIERRQSMRVLGGADDLHVRKARLERLRSLHVIGVVMGQQQMRQRPAAPLGLFGDRFAVRRVDARGRPELRLMNEQAEIVIQADKLRDFQCHGRRLLGRSVYHTRFAKKRDSRTRATGAPCATDRLRR